MQSWFDTDRLAAPNYRNFEKRWGNHSYAARPAVTGLGVTGFGVELAKFAKFAEFAEFSGILEVLRNP